MKFIFRLIILIAIIWVLITPGGKDFQSKVISNIKPIIEKFSTLFNRKIDSIDLYSNCQKPITYSLATFDTEFGISKEDFLGAIEEAESIWENALGKELFTYKPSDGILKINLIYDYRQIATEELSNLDTTIVSTKTSYNNLKSQYLNLKSQYTKMLATYNSKLANFNEKSKEYQKNVNYWNSIGGAPRNEYEALQKEKLALQSEFEQLKSKETEINTLSAQINKLVINLNRIANDLNLNVAKYNTIGSARGESFKEGVYTSNGFDQQIDIYEFNNHDKLVRVLTHELGHALGLEHTDDKTAIMYSQNVGDTATLSKTDIEMLQKKCASN